MKIDAATRIALVKKLEELAPYVGAADYFDRLREAVSGLRGEQGEPLKTSVGNIVLLGMWHNGQARVQFNDLVPVGSISTSARLRSAASSRKYPTRPWSSATIELRCGTNRKRCSCRRPPAWACSKN